MRNAGATSVGAPEYRRAAIRIRALRVSFRDALASAHAQEPAVRRRAVLDIVGRAHELLELIRTEMLSEAQTDEVLEIEREVDEAERVG